MLIYKLSQDSVRGYDTYDSCVVIAPTEEKAKEISIRELNRYSSKCWVNNPNLIKAELIGGSSLPEQLVLSSFNAG